MELDMVMIFLVLFFWTFWFFLCLIAFGFWPGSVLVASVLVVALIISFGA